MTGIATTLTSIASWGGRIDVANRTHATMVIDDTGGIDKDGSTCVTRRNPAAAATMQNDRELASTSGAIHTAVHGYTVARTVANVAAAPSQPSASFSHGRAPRICRGLGMFRTRGRAHAKGPLGSDARQVDGRHWRFERAALARGLGARRWLCPAARTRLRGRLGCTRGGRGAGTRHDWCVYLRPRSRGLRRRAKRDLAADRAAHGYLLRRGVG